MRITTETRPIRNTLHALMSQPAPDHICVKQVSLNATATELLANTSQLASIARCPVMQWLA